MADLLAIDVVVVHGDTAARTRAAHALETVARVREASASDVAASLLSDETPDCLVVGDVPAVRALAGAGVPVVAVGTDVDEAVQAGADDALAPEQVPLLLDHAVRAAVRRARARGGAVAAPDDRGRLLDALGSAVIATDPDGRVIYWNAAAEELYGWSAAEALGRSVVELTPAEHSREQAEEILAAHRAGRAWTGDFPVRRRDGSVFTAIVTTRTLVDASGRVTAVVGVSADVTERVHAERAARRLSSIVDSSGDAITLETLDGVVEAWNAAAEQLYGWTAHEAVGRHLHDLVVPPDRRAELTELQERTRQGLTVRDFETLRRRRDGSELEVAVTMSPVLDADGAVVGASAIARDITERRAWERRLRHAALHDDLTGLPNRALLADRLDQARSAAQRADAALALLFLDLDDFKDVNDVDGHLLGDEVLVQVARRLLAAVRPGDTVARFGGDEFVLLLLGAGAAEAERVARRTLAAVQRPLELGGRRRHVSASIGVAHAPPLEPAGLLRAADAAVHEAKKRGRAQVVSFAGELSQRAERRLVLTADLREELLASSGALYLCYQPIVDLTAGVLLGTEALLRWDHPRLGPVPAAETVAVAEAAGLAGDLDRWVLHRATAEIAAARRLGAVPVSAYLAVNVAAVNVSDGDFPDSVRSALAAAGLPASSLVLEVTETGVMRDVDEGVRVLTALCSSGLGLAIDDFGTGWASLTYVRRLPAGILKLDRTFVAALPDEHDRAIAASVVQLARTTRMTVVAEGVETATQLEALRELGCAAGQGWLWHAGARIADLPAVLLSLPGAAGHRARGSGPGTTAHR